jgi:hypothetical protein
MPGPGPLSPARHWQPEPEWHYPRARAVTGTEKEILGITLAIINSEKHDIMYFYMK